MLRAAAALFDVPRPYTLPLCERALGQERLIYSLPARDLGAGWHAGELALAIVGLGRIPSPAKIAWMRTAVAHAPLVVLPNDASVDAVVSLMRAGVADVIDPATPPAEAAARAFSHALDLPEEPLVGTSAAVGVLRREIAAVAPTRATVLLTGETGVGKGLVARLLHDASDRASRPFVHVDCAALAPTMIESELFGHEKGAFTGAVATRIGCFERAGDGTIFLDEIGELPPGLQAKLLRVLQDRYFERVGGTVTRPMRARVIAATNRELETAVAAGAFRADLYFRLRVFEIRVAPLRERRRDIPYLARAGAHRIAADLGIAMPPLPDDYFEALAERAWPGNVRELLNEVERTLIVARAGIGPSDRLPVSCCAEPAVPSPLAPAAERPQLEEVLRATGGNVSRAARRIGVARSTLRYQIERSDLAHLLLRD